MQRAAGFVSDVSTPEELGRVVGEELQHTPAANRNSLGMSALCLSGQLLARLALGALLLRLLLFGSNSSVAHGK